MAMTTLGKAARKVAVRAIRISKAATEADGREKAPEGVTPPASCQEGDSFGREHPTSSLTAHTVDTTRCMTLASPNGLPRPAGVIHLRVIEGGRGLGGGVPKPRPIAQTRLRGAGSEFLKLVHGS